jgi:osmotically-inducible protein OsmY
MKGQQHFVLGLFAGALAMYLLDPDRGRRRRALLRDQVVHGAHELEDFGESISGRARDLRNRARGRVVEARSRLHEEEVGDQVLQARVRSELGRVVSDPGAVEVSSAGGVVTLGGRVPHNEAARLLAQVSAVRGVWEVVNRLEVVDGSGEDDLLNPPMM